ncbi:MAG: DUF4118 domain-containing protein, partial [Pyrinomonadaceae bacterium]
MSEEAHGRGEAAPWKNGTIIVNRPHSGIPANFAQGRGAAGYALAVAGVAVVIAGLAPFRERVNTTTVALALRLVVLFSATLRGSGPALAASVVGVLGFNYFFLPPSGT